MRTALLLLVTLASLPVAAQSVGASGRSDVLSAPLWLRIDGSFSAQTLLHRTPPHVSVRFTGDSVDTLSVNRREAFPQAVVPGVTYRDVSFTFTVRSGLPHPEAFLDLLLGGDAADAEQAPSAAPPP